MLNNDVPILWLPYSVSGFIKSHMRDDIASKIIVGICAGDWKFDTSFKSWDEMAAKRAYEIADAMIKEREITNV